ncbi:MAG: hypothetical protein HYY76_09935 [Acidobacteria bacterium]|nr:hypothetical protein [Acidobacteriota bacterium]
MVIRTVFVAVVVAVVSTGGHASAQASLGTQLAELVALKQKVGDADTRTRVEALHRVWAIGLASANSDVKLSALGLLAEPAGSASDHIRMPAVYAIAEIANSTEDVRVKVRALATLGEPLQASQVPIRDVAIDAVNSITRSGSGAQIALAALKVLTPAVQSGNNGVRIPAINAVVRAVEGSRDDGAFQTALDLLVAPLDSSAAIGGMEVRMMAVRAVEKIGVEASEIGTKAKAMGLLQSYAARSGWEPEAKKRAQEASSNIQNSMKER